MVKYVACIAGKNGIFFKSTAKGIFYTDFISKNTAFYATFTQAFSAACCDYDKMSVNDQKYKHPTAITVDV